MSTNSKVLASQGKTIFDLIRDDLQFVSSQAQHVSINEDTLSAYSLTIPSKLPDNVFDDTHHFLGNHEETSAYVLILDAINFGSGFEPELVREGWETIDDSLYFTIATHVKSFFESEGVPKPADLQYISLDNVLRILHLNYHAPYSFDFARLCTLSLRELGQLIHESYDNSYENFVRSMNGSASDCVSALAKLKAFRDIHRYNDRDIHILKRAQSTAADLNDAFIHIDGQAVFDDFDRLTVLPDNDIPHVLRVENILSYSDELQSAIDQGRDIRSGSVFEIELRCCAAFAAEKIAEIKNIPAIHLDRILWHKCAEDQKYKIVSPHRTKSRFY